MKTQSVVIPRDQVLDTLKTVMQKELNKQFKGSDVKINEVIWVDEGLKFTFTLPW